MPSHRGHAPAFRSREQKRVLLPLDMGVTYQVSIVTTTSWSQDESQTVVHQFLRPFYSSGIVWAEPMASPTAAGGVAIPWRTGPFECAVPWVLCCWLRRLSNSTISITLNTSHPNNSFEGIRSHTKAKLPCL